MLVCQAARVVVPMVVVHRGCHCGSWLEGSGGGGGSGPGGRQGRWVVVWSLVGLAP